MQDDDPELASIRARMMREIVADHAQKASEPEAAPVPDHPVDLITAEFDGFLTRNPRVVVDLWAPWCGPCRQLTPILEGLAKSMNPQVAFAKVNVDEEPRIAGRFGVEGIPTVLGFLNGRLAGRWIGLRSRGDMEGLIRRTLLGGGTPQIRFVK